jgi:hypothetical protein
MARASRGPQPALIYGRWLDEKGKVKIPRDGPFVGSVKYRAGCACGNRKVTPI